MNTNYRNIRGLWLMILGAALFLGKVPAQSSLNGLPLSIEYQEAIQKGSRSKDGKPGANYFQNRASYEIQANFSPATRILTADCGIQYYNDSPDTLNEIVLRLLQNYYRPDAVRDDDIGKDESTRGLSIRQLAVNQQVYDSQEDTYIFEEKSTLLELKLKSPFYPGDTLSIELNYEVEISSGSSNRMGKYQKDAFFIGYWYPQVAVYDDIYGWDTLPYLGMVEFYQSVADFEVEINVPREFLVRATGSLQNPDSILAEPFLQRYKLAQEADTVINIIGRKEYKSGEKFTREDSLHSWRFVAQDVPDFAFALSDYYHWDGSSIEVDSPARRVFVDAFYNPKARDFRYVAQFAREAIHDLSTRIPGVPYPYSSMTVFNGDLGFGGGMEFPMIVNDGSSFSLGNTFRLTYHEIAHTYFPFYMGTNEKRHAWMDEGWASFLPADLVREKGYNDSPMASNVSTYKRFAGLFAHVPLMAQSIETAGMSYYVQAYYHSATAYHMLRDVMGDSLFVEALQTYIHRWANKHPQPYDFFYTFDDVAGESLAWFWKPWFFEKGKPDLGIRDLQIKRKRFRCEVENIGKIPIPIHLTYVFEDGSQEEERISAAVWKKGEDTFPIQRVFAKRLKKVKLGDVDIPDTNRSNN